jgi:hypothetical protein
MYRQQIGEKFKTTRGKVVNPNRAEWVSIQLDGADRHQDVLCNELFLLPLAPVLPRRTVTVKGGCEAHITISWTTKNPLSWAKPKPEPAWTVVKVENTHAGHPQYDQDAPLKLKKRHLELYPQIGQQLRQLQETGMPSRWQAVCVQDKLGSNFKLDIRSMARVQHAGPLLFLTPQMSAAILL